MREYTAADAESGGLGELMREHAKSGTEGMGFISAIVRARKPGGAGKAFEPREVVSVTARLGLSGLVAASDSRKLNTIKSRDALGRLYSCDARR